MIIRLYGGPLGHVAALCTAHYVRAVKLLLSCSSKITVSLTGTLTQRDGRLVILILHFSPN